MNDFHVILSVHRKKNTVVREGELNAKRIQSKRI